MALQLPSMSPLSPTATGHFGRRLSSNRFALRSSFICPSLHLLLPPPPPYQPISSAAPKFSTRITFKYFYNNRTPFKRSPDNSCRVGFIAAAMGDALKDGVAVASEFADMPAIRGKDYGKTKMRYPDYAETESGLQYKDLRAGSGPTPKMGETVVVDWDGYTIGYYGRIFEARNKTKGGSFEGDDKDYFKFTLGSQQVIPAFEEAILGMAAGGIRRIIVPPELGYPENDFNKSGPRPTTFSGQRALDFVLRNQGLIDKTLLFDIELLKIIRN
ncbi:peptidyl-prolyl cis-trans isomerase FKBP19, chloroplastic isoform X2 [Macadamia integrifolia]|uniref:peptidyl-prolyl cis-trans isomerase FKBP19, chloroplastic isoform X2 n=1 Tax=Macadamia integrifolia TaxID=60698 RepID=UPI001C4E3F8D|nr:peptidyl-prolyl cis-trans isomerase FKBP19, chloroplastic isoform X2 [Macadamia integrifolia]